MFKVKLFRGSYVSTKIFYLEIFIFSVEKFPNYGMLYLVLQHQFINVTGHVKIDHVSANYTHIFLLISSVQNVQ